MITIDGSFKHEGFGRSQECCLLKVEWGGSVNRCRGESTKMPYDVFGVAFRPQRKTESSRRDEHPESVLSLKKSSNQIDAELNSPFNREATGRTQK